MSLKRLLAVFVLLLCLIPANGAQAGTTFGPAVMSVDRMATEGPWVDVRAFGAKGDGVTDDTVAIQSAINTGKPVLISQGIYLAHSLTVSTTGQTLMGLGKAIIKKNANGPIITVSAANVTFENLQFRGDASTPTYTGDNVYAIGNHFSMLNCGSRWAYGRAVKAIGAHTQIIGTNDIYQTTDATATGYDIELGLLGTPTLYHKLIGLYTSQATGGIYLIETGNTAIIGGQFGKLTVDKGNAGRGNHGPYVVGNRVNGHTSILQSGTFFSANSFSDNVTIHSGTNSGVWDASNVIIEGKTLQNNDTDFTVIYPTGEYLKFGNPSSAGHRFAADGTIEFASNIKLKNNNALYFRNSADSAWVQAFSYSPGDNLFIGTSNGANFTMVGSGTGGVYQTVDGRSVVQTYTSGFRPHTDNTYNNGTSKQRWANLYATSLKPGAGIVTWTSGAGSPEGVVTAAVGSLYTRTDGRAQATLYVKEKGNGNIGWVAK